MQSDWDLYKIFFTKWSRDTKRYQENMCTKKKKDSFEEKVRKCPHVNKEKRLEGTRTTLALDLGLLVSRAVRNRFQ